MRAIIAGVVGLLGFAGAAHAQDSFADAFWQFRASAGFDFSSGTYGATKPTEILYIPPTHQAA